MQSRIRFKALMLLLIASAAFTLPEARTDLEGDCDNVICAGYIFQCSEQAIRWFCEAFCGSWQSGACGYDDDCDDGEYAFICYS